MQRRWTALAAITLLAGAAQGQATGNQGQAGAPYRVFFDWGKAVVSQDGAATLDDVAEILLRPETETFSQIVGHSDRSGPAGANRRSALQRAAAARDYLLKRGVAADRIVVTSQGEDAPFIATADGVREPQNRRVDVMIYARPER